MPLHSARVARNVSDKLKLTLREKFGFGKLKLRASRAGRRGSLVCERQQRAVAPDSSFAWITDEANLSIRLTYSGTLNHDIYALDTKMNIGGAPKVIQIVARSAASFSARMSLARNESDQTQIR